MSVPHRSKPGRTIFAAFMALLTVAVLMAWAPPVSAASSEDGYSGSDMWLHYMPVSDPALLASVPGVGHQRSSWRTPSRNPVYRHTQDLRMEAGAVREAGAIPAFRRRGTSWSEASAGCWTGRCR